MSKVEKDTFLGQVEIAPAAVELIVGIAVSKMKEVHAVKGTLKSSVVDLFAKPTHTKGVYLNQGETGDFTVDVYVTVYYGENVPEVAKKIQERVKEQVLFMCDIDIETVNVFVTHLVSGTGESVE